MKTSNLAQGLSALTVFRSLLKEDIFNKLLAFLQCENQEKALSTYADFVSSLYEQNGGLLGPYVEKCCYHCENVYVKMLGKQQTPPPHLAQSVQRELTLLQQVADLTPEALTANLPGDVSLPGFVGGGVDLIGGYAHRTRHIERYGYGKYAQHNAFYVDGAGDIVAVKNPDRIHLSDLVDYQKERQPIIDNTAALLAEKPAANVLLTGDAGTGKSSTIKAVAGHFYSQGLRLIELRKDQMGLIPAILDELAENPLKFILFIDDLSFLKDDDNFNHLKAVLEGSVSARSNNVVVYATSNRRHLVRETFSAREGDEIHRNDTVQEMVSLSNRFGLHITFQKPTKDTYLNIVHKLAQQFGLNVPTETLDLEAERFALERGGRSARLARQYVDWLRSKEE